MVRLQFSTTDLRHHRWPAGLAGLSQHPGTDHAIAFTKPSYRALSVIGSRLGRPQRWAAQGSPARARVHVGSEGSGPAIGHDLDM
jgi:hypothetical protein